MVKQARSSFTSFSTGVFNRVTSGAAGDLANGYRLIAESLIREPYLYMDIVSGGLKHFISSIKSTLLS